MDILNCQIPTLSPPAATLGGGGGGGGVGRVIDTCIREKAWERGYYSNSYIQCFGGSPWKQCFFTLLAITQPYYMLCTKCTYQNDQLFVSSQSDQIDIKSCDKNGRQVEVL